MAKTEKQPALSIPVDGNLLSELDRYIERIQKDTRHNVTRTSIVRPIIIDGLRKIGAIK